jgi:hypothetical protein
MLSLLLVHKISFSCGRPAQVWFIKIKLEAILLVTHCDHNKKSNLGTKFMKDKVGGCDMIYSYAISLYAFNTLLTPKSQQSRVVCRIQTHKIIHPGKTPKCFFRFFGNLICASRTFTSFSDNFTEILSEGRQSDENEISVTTQDIALFLERSRDLRGKVCNIFSFVVSQNNIFSA